MFPCFVTIDKCSPCSLPGQLLAISVYLSDQSDKADNLSIRILFVKLSRFGIFCVFLNNFASLDSAVESKADKSIVSFTT